MPQQLRGLLSTCLTGMLKRLVSVGLVSIEYFWTLIKFDIQQILKPGMLLFVWESAAKKAMKIAADCCIYTNHNFTIEQIDVAQKDLEDVKQTAVLSS